MSSKYPINLSDFLMPTEEDRRQFELIRVIVAPWLDGLDERLSSIERLVAMQMRREIEGADRAAGVAPPDPPGPADRRPLVARDEPIEPNPGHRLMRDRAGFVVLLSRPEAMAHEVARDAHSLSPMAFEPKWGHLESADISACVVWADARDPLRSKLPPIPPPPMTPDGPMTLPAIVSTLNRFKHRGFGTWDEAGVLGLPHVKPVGVGFWLSRFEARAIAAAYLKGDRP